MKLEVNFHPWSYRSQADTVNFGLYKSKLILVFTLSQFHMSIPIREQDKKKLRANLEKFEITSEALYDRFGIEIRKIKQLTIEPGSFYRIIERQDPELSGLINGFMAKLIRYIIKNIKDDAVITYNATVEHDLKGAHKRVIADCIRKNIRPLQTRKGNFTYAPWVLKRCSRQWARVFAAPLAGQDRPSAKCAQTPPQELQNFFVVYPGLKRLIGGILLTYYNSATADSLEVEATAEPRASASPTP